MTDELPIEWLAKLRCGDDDAARQLFAKFSQRLCRLAEQHLCEKLRQRVDGEDVMQSALRTFFVRSAKGEFQVNHDDELWRLLATITIRKARAVWRRNNTEQREIRRDVSLDNAAHTADWREPTVVEALILADEIDTVLTGLSEQHVQALELRLAGHEPPQAAEIMGISRQAFHRLLQPLKDRIRRRWDDVFPADVEAPSETKQTPHEGDVDGH